MEATDTTDVPSSAPDPTRTPAPSAGAIDARFAEMVRTGSPELRRQLIEEHQRLAIYFARRYRNRGVPDDDLEQVAMIGLIGAVDRFDPSRGTQFSTFAGRTILGELRRYFRDHTWSVHVPRRQQEVAALVRQTVDEMMLELTRPPRPDEVAHRLGLDVDAVLVALDAAASYNAASLDQPRSAREQRSLESYLASDEASFSATETNLVVEKLLDSLPERERTILLYRLRDGLSQQEIGERVGLSQMHVSRLIRRSLQRFREELLVQ